MLDDMDDGFGDALLASLRDTLGQRLPRKGNVSFSRVARENLSIRTVDNRVASFRLRPIQHRYLAAKRLAKIRGRRPRYLLLKYRRGGFTTVEQGLSYYMASRRRNVNVLSLAHDGETSARIFRIALLMHERDPDAPPIKGPGNQYRLEFPGLNSLFYIGAASGRGAARGDTLSRVHWSEVAWSCPGYSQIEKQRGLLTGLQEAASHGEMVLETTPNGSELFRELYMDAKSGRNDWTPIFLPWFEDVNNRAAVTPEIVEEIRDTLDEEERSLIERVGLDWEQVRFRRQKQKDLKHLFYQEYPEDDESCWLISGTPFFDARAVLSLKDNCRGPALIDTNSHGWVPEGADLKPGGYVMEWEPPQDGVSYCMGVDTSEGLKGCDNNGFGIMRRDNGRMVCAAHGLFSIRQLSSLVYEYHKRFHDCLVGIERENHGHAVIQGVMDYGLNRSHHDGGSLYFFTPSSATDADIRRVSRAGWSTNSVTRPLMLESLRDYLEAPDVLDRVRDRHFISECLTFRMQANGSFSHDPGSYDDCLMKWAIANMMRVADWRRGGLLVAPSNRWRR